LTLGSWLSRALLIIWALQAAGPVVATGARRPALAARLLPIVRGVVHHVLTGRGSGDCRLVCEYRLDDLMEGELVWSRRDVCHGVNDLGVGDPRLNPCALRHLGGPHMILAVVR